MENNKVITEKDYPIAKLWMFKAPIIIVFMNVVALFFGRYFPVLVLAFPVYLIANPLIRGNFHYSLEEKFFIIRQGVISKKQRNLPYGVIQNVFVKQDLFDRIFGLAKLIIENASQSGGARNIRTSQESESVGAAGNKVNIPGLKKQYAEELKNLILNKIKENPIEDSQSGL